MAVLAAALVAPPLVAPPGADPAASPAVADAAWRQGGVAIERRCATADAGGVLIGAPSPARRCTDCEPRPAEPLSLPGADAAPPARAAGAADEDDAGVPVAAVPGDGGADGSGAPRPGAPADVPEACSAQRPARAGEVPRAAGSCAGVEAPWPAAGVPARLGAEGPVDDAAARCATGVGAAGAWVSGRGAGVTTAEGATERSVRTGACSAAGGGASVQVSEAEGAAAERRWTGMAVRDVSDGVTDGRAITSPGGAVGPVSWPSGCTIGGSGWWPGTWSRNGAAGATSGGSPTVRWIGGSDAQAPVGAAGCVGEGADGAAGPSGATGEGPSDGVLRPNGHGRRTGVTPPRTGAC